jgi:hypothetical protein
MPAAAGTTNITAPTSRPTKVAPTAARRAAWKTDDDGASRGVRAPGVNKHGDIAVAPSSLT